MSGLAAGIRLSHYDKNVCILEKHFRSGGLNSFYKRDGRTIDTGLHAMTNFVGPEASKSSPLLKLLRQLRLKYDEFELLSQNFSTVSFSGAELKFSNDFSLLEGEVSRLFPSESENFMGLCSFLNELNAFDLGAGFVSARSEVCKYIKDPLLIEMLFCPLMLYGSAVENDMDLSQFAIMFRSIFIEGFCRPSGGVRKIISALERRFSESGGKLMKKCEVRKIVSDSGAVKSIVLDSGEELECKALLSTAGLPETLRLIDPPLDDTSKFPPGEMSFIESVFILPKGTIPADYKTTIQFFNDSRSFAYRKPDSPFDSSSGVLCCPANFKGSTEFENEDLLRVTMIARHEPWFSANPDEYSSMKEKVLDVTARTCERRVGIPGFRDKVIFSDIFTPRTVSRFTGRINGAVYGSPAKLKDGRTPLKNLFICGTDQGFLGITGAMLSGVSMANMHLLVL